MFTNKKGNSRIFLYQTFKSNTPKSKKKIKKNKNHYNNNMKKTHKMLQKIGNRYVT